MAGICGNQAFPVMPRHLRKSGIPGNAEAFAENVIYLTMLKFWEMYQSTNYFKTLMAPIT